MSCALWGVDCGLYGDCDDLTGPAECVCDTGWSGTTCSVCTDDSYENNDYDSQAYLLTSNFSAANLVICGTDKDWFAIYLPETAVINVNALFTHFTGGDIDLSLWYIYDSRPSFDNRVANSDSSTSNESMSYTVPAGKAGRYLIEVRGFGAFVRNEYDLVVTVAGPGCNTCEYLSNECGDWDDACGGEINCDHLCPGLGTTHVCEEYQWGTCAQYYDDLMYGCCEGALLHTKASGTPANVNCASFGRECGWKNAADLPPRTGYFSCNIIGTSAVAPPGVFSTCPVGMTWAP